MPLSADMVKVSTSPAMSAERPALHRKNILQVPIDFGHAIGVQAERLIAADAERIHALPLPPFDADGVRPGLREREIADLRIVDAEQIVPN